MAIFEVGTVRGNPSNKSPWENDGYGWEPEGWMAGDRSPRQRRPSGTLICRVTAMAAALPENPAVEAELGKLRGKEDGLDVKEGDDIYTDPEEAVRCPCDRTPPIQG